MFRQHTGRFCNGRDVRYTGVPPLVSVYVGHCCARYVWLTRGLSRAVSVSHVHVSATMYVCMYLPHHSAGIVSFIQSYSSYLETRNATTRFSVRDK